MNIGVHEASLEKKLKDEPRFEKYKGPRSNHRRKTAVKT